MIKQFYSGSPKLVICAAEFAKAAHATQKRKYTNEDYILHCAEVAQIVSEYRPYDVDATAIAWLHDTVEDCGISYQTLVSMFGVKVAAGVSMLTDNEIGNRAERKRLARIRLSKSPDYIQDIKCADLISNTKSIVEYDPKFAVTFLKEKRLLLDMLTLANPELIKKARWPEEEDVKIPEFINAL